jgi:hypothetical protein
MNLVYGITVSTEVDEVKRLIDLLTKNTSDKIVVQIDSTKDVESIIKSIDSFGVNIKSFDFTGDFSSFKNNLNKICKEEENADYVFQIDADEMISEYLVKNVKEIIMMNTSVDLYYFPRINIVDGITSEHIKKWNWKLDSQNRINFPDYQGRLYKSNLNWSGKVHERVVGGTNYSILPPDEEYCLYHHKNIDRQENQNRLYNTLL